MTLLEAPVLYTSPVARSFSDPPTVFSCLAESEEARAAEAAGAAAVLARVKAEARATVEQLEEKLGRIRRAAEEERCRWASPTRLTDPGGYVSPSINVRNKNVNLGVRIGALLCRRWRHQETTVALGQRLDAAVSHAERLQVRVDGDFPRLVDSLDKLAALATDSANSWVGDLAGCETRLGRLGEQVWSRSLLPSFSPHFTRHFYLLL